MTNAELIKALKDAELYLCYVAPRCYASIEAGKAIRAAADALEAADEKIADYTAAVDALDDSNDAYIKENERLKKRIAELEAQIPKEGVWKKILQNSDGTSDYECSACLGFIMNVPDDDEHPLCSFCPNCGAKMKGELEEDDANN